MVSWRQLKLGSTAGHTSLPRAGQPHSCGAGCRDPFCPDIPFLSPRGSRGFPQGGCSHSCFVMRGPPEVTVVSCGPSNQSDELLPKALVTVVGSESLSRPHSSASAADEPWPPMESRCLAVPLCLKPSLPNKNCPVAAGRGSALTFDTMGRTRVPHLCSHLSQEAGPVIVLTDR